MFDVKITDIERTYEPHTFVQFAWIENWFLAQVFASHVTDFSLEAGHFKTGVAMDNSIPAVPDMALAKSITIPEAKLHRKKAASIPLVPHEPSVEAVKWAPTIEPKKETPVLVLHSNQSQPRSSQPGTPLWGSDKHTPR